MNLAEVKVYLRAMARRRPGVSCLIALAMIATTVCCRPAHALNDGLALTPPMGWNSWNAFACNINEAEVEASAAAMASNGMQAAGYQYVNIDDCWASTSRDSNGNIQADPTAFPDGIAAVATYVHSLGLKLGIYTDVACCTCQNRMGSGGHEQQDIDTFASWGVDYVKVDWCGGGPDAQTTYAVWKNAILNSPRPMILSICEWGQQSPWLWGSDTGNLFRISGDISDNWSNMQDNLYADATLAPYNTVGGWNDPDMLEVGNGGMTAVEDQSHFSMWCMLAAPLIAGNDVRSMTSATQTTLTNTEAIGVDQDPDGLQGILVSGAAYGAQVWYRPLHGQGNRAEALFNSTGTATNMTVNWSDIGLVSTASATVRDLWAHSNLGSFTGSYTVSVPADATVLLKIVGSEPQPPTGTSYLSDLQWTYQCVGSGTLQKDKSVQGNTITLNGTTYPKGLGAEAGSVIRYWLGGAAQTFQSDIGVDSEVGANGTVDFQVWGDGVKLFDSGVMVGGGAKQSISVNTAGVNELKLVVTCDDNAITDDDADWANARITVGSATVPAAPTNLAATAGNSQVALSWSASSGATSYNLLRSTVNGSGYASVATGVSSTSYTNTGLTNGATYYFVVTAANSAGTSGNSNQASSTPNNSVLITGSWYGTAGSWSNDGDIGSYAFDGNTATFFDGPDASGDYTGIDVGSGNTATVTSINYMDRPSWGARMVGGEFQGTNGDPVNGPYTTLATIATQPTDGVWSNLTVSASGYRYLRYLSPTNGFCNVSEIQFMGSVSGGSAPSAPTGLTATASSTQVALSWTAGGGATSYNVYRGTSAGGESATAIATGVTATAYTNTGLTNGTTYYFTVKALNAAGTSGASNEAAGTPTASAPAAPTGLTATAGNVQLTLSWTASSGATSYNVYRGTSAGGENSAAIVTGLTATGYTNTGLTNGVTYYFVVKALNATGTSGASNEASGTPTSGGGGLSNGVYKVVSVLSGFALDDPSGGGAGTGVDQQAYSGADQQWQLTSVTGGYYEIASGANGLALSGPTGQAQLVLQTYSGLTTQLWSFTASGSNYLITNESTGQLVDDFNNSLVSGNPVGQWGNDGGTNQQWTVTAVSALPPAPTGLAATAGSAQVALGWTASSGATSYNIYRGTSAGGESATAVATGITTTAYTNTGLTNGATYYFTVKAVNGSGTSSSSNEAAATPTTGAPAAPTGLTATGGNALVSLTWTASTGATSYNVLRSTVSGSGYVSVSTGITVTNYTNTGLTNGTTYYFVVTAANSSGTSGNSNQAGATPVAYTINYSSGFTSTGLQLNGNAVLNGTNLELTNGGAGQESSAFYTTKVNVASFTTAFSLTDTSAQANGITFCIQSVGDTALDTGGNGSGLGYQGMATSVAVKFDVFTSVGGNTNSTGLYTDGAQPTTPATDLTPSGVVLSSGHVINVTLSYNGTMLTVTETDATTHATATQTYTINIPGTVGASTAYVGFTGATGGETAIQQVLAWTY